MTYTLAELLASGLAVEVEPDDEPCDRCGWPEALVATRFARLCFGCHADVKRQGTGYARLAGEREPEWRHVVKLGYRWGYFDHLDELDEP